MIKRYAAGGDNPGTIYAVIKAVNTSGSPTGPVLSSGTTNGNTLTKDYPGEWRTITMSSYTIKKNTMYALILYNASGYDGFGWFVADGNPYSGGNALESVDGGATWITRSTFDMNFEVWGLPPEVNAKQPEKPFADSSSSSPEYSLPGKSDVKITRVYAQSSQVAAGNPAVIYGNIANRGDLADSYEATLIINGKIEATRSGTIPANVAIPLEFTVYRDVPGTYQVDLNGQKTFFTIVENNSGIESGANSRSLALIIWGILVIAVAVSLSIVIARHRKSSY